MHGFHTLHKCFKNYYVSLRAYMNAVLTWSNSCSMLQMFWQISASKLCCKYHQNFSVFSSILVAKICSCLIREIKLKTVGLFMCLLYFQESNKLLGNCYCWITYVQMYLPVTYHDYETSPPHYDCPCSLSMTCTCYNDVRWEIYLFLVHRLHNAHLCWVNDSNRSRFGLNGIVGNSQNSCFFMHSVV